MAMAKSTNGRDGRTRQFARTKLCRFHVLGMCVKGPQCPFAHGAEELRPLPDLRCTKLCKTMMQVGSCQDPNCSYAHTEEELRAPAESLGSGSAAGASTPGGLGSMDSALSCMPPGLSWDSAVGNKLDLDYTQDDGYSSWPMQQFDKVRTPESRKAQVSSGLEMSPAYVPLPSVGPSAEGPWARNRMDLPEPQMILGPLFSQDIAESSATEWLGKSLPAYGAFQTESWGQSQVPGSGLSIDQADDTWSASNLQLKSPIKSTPMRTVRTSESTLCTLSDERQ
mmetsp:Transcript_54614/g.130318  ORF Transcript_54614/g.130318 Transcript_54614/m.130318 type:complete len:281 (+) Transcript_54614:173-1015(+)